MISIIKSLSNLLIDTRLGVDTLDKRVPKLVDVSNEITNSKLMTNVGSLAYVHALFFLSGIQFNEKDVFFDIGCGCGRIICLMARKSIKKCIGIEIDHSTAEVAKRNSLRLRKPRCDVEIREDDAAQANYAGGTIYWMYNPFNSMTLEAVLTRIHCSVLKEPRSVRIIYVNPLFEEVVHKQSWLEHRGDRRLPAAYMRASYWESRASGRSTL